MFTIHIQKPFSRRAQLYHVDIQYMKYRNCSEHNRTMLTYNMGNTWFVQICSEHNCAMSKYIIWNIWFVQSTTVPCWLTTCETHDLFRFVQSNTVPCRHVIDDNSNMVRAKCNYVDINYLAAAKRQNWRMLCLHKSIALSKPFFHFWTEHSTVVLVALDMYYLPLTSYKMFEPSCYVQYCLCWPVSTVLIRGQRTQTFF